MNSGASPHRSASLGFTLLEVLIATALLALLMSLLLGGMRIGADSWSQGEKLSERASRLLVVENLLRSHLSDLKPLFESSTDPRDAGQPPKLLFRGGESWLEYAGTLPPQVRGGMYKFRLHLVNEAERSDLKLAIRPFSSAQKGAEIDPIEDVLVLEEVETLRFSYFKRKTLESEAQWLDTWNENTLPAMIRIDIRLQGDPPWPVVYIAPRVDTTQ